MAALTADANISTVGTVVTIPVSVNEADTWYRGSIVYTDASGGAQVVSATTLDRCLGISPKQQVVAVGDIAQVIVFGAVWMPLATSHTAADEGELLYMDMSATSTDNPEDLDSLANITEAIHDSVFGQVLRATATQMLVFINPGMTGRAFTTTVTNMWS